MQIDNLELLHKVAADQANESLSALTTAALNNENLFEHLIDATKHCSLGQITDALFKVGGQYRRSM